MLNIAIIATGFIAHNHADEIVKMQDIKLVGVVDINEKIGKEFAQQYNTKYYSTFEDLMTHEKVDIADICVPTNLHEKCAVECAQAGLHILCEKPFALESAAGQRIVDECKRNDVLLMVAHVLRFWPEYMYMKKVYDEGKLGTVEIANLSRLSAMPRWSEFYDNPNVSGGGLYDIHLHDVDYACYLFGDVKKVYSVGYKNLKGAWNNLTSTITFKNGVHTAIEACQEMTEGYPFSMHCRMLGTKGTIEFSLISRELLRGEAKSEVYLYEDNKESMKAEIPQGNGYYNEIQYFAQCVKNHEQPISALPQKTVEVLKVIEAVKESLETGKIIEL